MALLCVPETSNVCAFKDLKEGRKRFPMHYIFSHVHGFRLQCLGILRCDFETSASPNFVPERLERIHSFRTFMKIPLTHQFVPQR